MISGIPSELQALFSRSSIEDRSYSRTAKTYRLVSPERVLFVKLAARELLERERLMSAFLHRYGLAPAVVSYGEGEAAYLVTEALTGSDGVAPEHRSAPRRLAAVFGESLRILHETPVGECPVQDRDAEMRVLAETRLAAGDYDAGHIPEPLDEAAARLRSSIADDQVVLHGDYCLPNIVFSDFQLSGFVDLGNGGLGGRHYDLYWGVWTLEYNLRSPSYRDRFLDAYGRDRFVPELLDYWRVISGLT